MRLVLSHKQFKLKVCFVLQHKHLEVSLPRKQICYDCCYIFWLNILELCLLKVKLVIIYILELLLINRQGKLAEDSFMLRRSLKWILIAKKLPIDRCVVKSYVFMVLFLPMLLFQ
jgi:hypothetical protein